VTQKLTAMKRIRKERGLRQKDVAEKLGIATHSYTRYECGVRRPNIDTLLKIADILDVKASDLLEK
jgi:transcriptional regulator with XRE-family HTH domain